MIEDEVWRVIVVEREHAPRCEARSSWGMLKAYAKLSFLENTGPCDWFEEDEHVFADVADGRAKAIVKRLKIFQVGLLRDHEERVVPDVACKWLVEELYMKTHGVVM